MTYSEGEREACLKFVSNLGSYTDSQDDAMTLDGIGWALTRLSVSFSFLLSLMISLSQFLQSSAQIICLQVPT